MVRSGGPKVPRSRGSANPCFATWHTQILSHDGIAKQKHGRWLDPRSLGPQVLLKCRGGFLLDRILAILNVNSSTVVG